MTTKELKTNVELACTCTGEDSLKADDHAFYCKALPIITANTKSVRKFPFQGR